MLDRRLIASIDDAPDYTPKNAACSAEPFARPDHKAKKHSRPSPRRNEKIGGGHFVFRRGREGRVHPNQWPFEHPTDDSAIAEAGRLAKMTGDTFEVYSRVAVAHGGLAVEMGAAEMEAGEQ